MHKLTRYGKQRRNHTMARTRRRTRWFEQGYDILRLRSSIVLGMISFTVITVDMTCNESDIYDRQAKAPYSVPLGDNGGLHLQ